MAHAQRPDFVFRAKRKSPFKSAGGRQFSRLLAAEVCAPAVVMLDTPCSEVVWRGYPLHSPFSPSLLLPCVIVCHRISTGVYLLSFLLSTCVSWQGIDYKLPEDDTIVSKHVYLLTPWCRVLEKLNGLQLVKKFPAFHGTRRFITALKSVRHLSLSCTSPIQSIYPHPTSWRSILILSTHLRLGLPSSLLPSGFPTKTLYTPYPHPYAPHAQPISFFSILSPAQYWVRSTNHLAPRYVETCISVIIYEIIVCICWSMYRIIKDAGTCIETKHVVISCTCN